MKNKIYILIGLMIIIIIGVGYIGWQRYYGSGSYEIVKYRQAQYHASDFNDMTIDEANTYLKVEMKPTGINYRGREVYSARGKDLCDSNLGCGETVILLLKDKDKMLFQMYSLMGGP